jgi:hypothetical protein
MGLLTLTTNLKSLKYGSDRPGGGNSGQPFVQQEIPPGQIPFASTSAGLIDNIVNGTELVVSSAGRDVMRLGKFFTTTPGILFIAKQNVLSQTNVRTQANNVASPRIVINGGPYTPTNTLAQIAGSAIGSHFYKQGLTPGGSRLPKYGDNDTIIQVTGADEGGIGNRLVSLYDSKIQNHLTDFKLNSISLLGTEILRYTGGPGSALGIGSTKIRFASSGKFRTGINNPLYTENRNQFYGILPGGADKVIVADPALALEAQLTYQNKTVTGLVDFRARLRDGIENSNILSKSPSYSNGDNQTIETRVFLGDPGQRDKNIISYTKGAIINGANKSVALDKVNAKPLYRSEFVANKDVNDLVKFRIEAIDNDSPQFGVFMHFRALIDSFSDGYSADWSSAQYVGRGEKFYNYNGFDRTINMSWTVAAQSKDELIPMYQKLNFLASNLMPDYNGNGYMRGPLVRLTVGGYLYSQPGFITALTYDIPQEATWEIGINDSGQSDPSVKELPHMIKVTGFTFTPIHTFVPRKQINTYGGTGVSVGRIDNVTNPIYGDEISSFGTQRYIALSTGDNNNYDN